MWIIIVLFVVVSVVYFWGNPTAIRIRKIQSLINKDRTVCDVINRLEGWNIDNVKTEALRIIVNSPITVYALYITYKGKNPTKDEIKFLYAELTKEDSVVTKAHKMNVPVEQLMGNDNDEEYWSIMKKTMDCSIDIIAAENAYYQKEARKDLAITLSKPTAIIDRRALICAVVTVMFGKAIHKRIHALQLIDTMIKFGKITPKEKEHAVCRFDERYKYFVDEIDIEMRCSSFLPMALIYTLRHPDEVPTRDSCKVGAIEAIIHWNIILEVIAQYFNDNDRK